MKFKELNGLKIPILGIGTSNIGNNLTAIKTAIELGFTHIDTAESYGNGRVEKLVGKAVNGFRREDLFIATKVKRQNLRYDDLILAAKRSLQQLNTSYIDLYYIHGPSSEVPIEETMSAMDRLIAERVTRFIGVSNFSVEQLREAQRCTQNKIVAAQVQYNLLNRNSGQWLPKAESEVLPYCQENGIIVVAYRPLALGRLAKPGVRMLDEMAQRYKKTPAQIAINWLISKPNVVTVAKAANTDHLKENLDAIDWRLNEQDIYRLNHDFPIEG